MMHQQTKSIVRKKRSWFKGLICAFLLISGVSLIIVLVYFHCVNNLTSFTTNPINHIQHLNRFNAMESYLQLSDIHKNESKAKKAMSFMIAAISTPFEIIKNENVTVNQEPPPRPDHCDDCFRHNFKYLLSSDHICQENDSSTKIEIIILIFTVHKNKAQRQTIRNTWLSYAKNNSLDSNIRYAFLLGKSSDSKLNKMVIEESKLFKDILQEDFEDTYKNLTYKTIMGFKWVSSKCKEAQFVMKTDDDMYVHVPNILNTVRNNRAKLQKSVAGYCYGHPKPIRNHHSKFYISKRSFPDNVYPPYCSGSGYVTSMNVAKDIFAVSSNVPFIFFEDVYIGFCVKKLGYGTISLPGFRKKINKYDPCLFHGNTLRTTHGILPEMMQKIWDDKCLNEG